MAFAAQPVDETGTLTRDGAAFILQRDRGGWYTLHLQRVPVDHVEKRVRLIGTLIAEGVVSVEGVSAL
ncbi:DUF5818 domain-containing protein [Sphingomonas sp. PAMC 26605]|uniref:DUF5818 domain-containing protein n=1 Tax=Sphingomonas sp. PAMC 26605 TaxID=1112214 RepID=UPI00026CAC01|nr:DUF5818 domain-containing protein [Sphingomonas sp. PAMC 26605]